MIADIVLIVLFALSLINGYKKGFVKTLFRFAGLFIFLVLFVFLYNPVGAAFGGGTTGVIAAAAVSFAVSYAAEHLLCKIAKLPLLNQVNKLLGALLGLVNGAVLTIILSFVFVSVDFLNAYTENSQIINYVISYFK